MIASLRYFILLILGAGSFYWFNVPNNCEISGKILKKQTEDLPTIYAITPTYYRLTQKADLTRLSHCLQLVPNVFWVLVEDANSTSELVRGILHRGGLTDRSVQLIGKTPDDQKPKNGTNRLLTPRGVIQRNIGLDFVTRRMAEKGGRSIVYFMDDDNAYSVELFHEMAKIEEGRVGVWPVGLVGGLKVERPFVSPNGTISGFGAMWQPGRAFPIDMAAFAISGDLFQKNPDAKFNFKAKGNFLESNILEQVTKRSELQPLANLCTEVWVWHTRTEKPSMEQENNYVNKYHKASDYGLEV
ncbi:galactosylgalactosylxylosylprotein 3-beta-glucuronosyltransferase I-like [Culicoides brevitarsis]|uniref:galactosylgalactosylxylosylprotein 3-beta-glucuronosyltransferase I-like n=1 Tax=Culicoides brevitarsis TaxID=469753 RepID=UPI00307BFC3C